MSKLELKDIEKQVNIAYALPLPKDIQNIIIQYIEDSLPIYKEWATCIYDNHILALMGENKDIYSKKRIIKRIVQIFLTYYGMSISILIENINDGVILNILSLSKLIKQEIVRIPFRLCYDDHYTLIHKISKLWQNYQCSFYRYVFDEIIFYYGLSDYPYPINTKFYSKVREAWNLKLNPFEVDIITGTSFIPWIFLTNSINFETKKEQKRFENLLLEMLKKIDLTTASTNINNKYTLLLFIILDKTQFDNTLRGLSPRFLYEILKRMDLNKLNDTEKFKLSMNISNRNKEIELSTFGPKIFDLLHIYFI